MKSAAIVDVPEISAGSLFRKVKGTLLLFFAIFSMYFAVTAQHGAFQLIKRGFFVCFFKERQKEKRKKEMGELFIHLPLNFLAAMPVLA